MPPFYYRDLVHYIKTQNRNIPNLQNKTKMIYKSILEKGSEKKWKDEIKNLDFKKSGQTLTFHQILTLCHKNKEFYIQHK